MPWSNLLVPAVLVAVCAAAQAQGPTYGLGKTPSAEAIQAWDTAIGPQGKELPPGQGTAKEGAAIYARQCAACHGQTGTEGPFNRLVGGQGTLNGDQPVKTVGSFWPFATTLWDYINRAMPDDKPGSLSADQVYALTAFLLYRNGIIPESDLIDASSLPKVRMPNRNGFVPDPRPDWKAPSGGRN